MIYEGRVIIKGKKIKLFFMGILNSKEGNWDINMCVEIMCIKYFCFGKKKFLIKSM